MYNQKYYLKRENSRAFKVEIKEIISLLNPKKSDRILEIGCGSGVLLKELEKYKCSIIGIDVSKEAIEMAKKNTSISKLILSSTDKLDFDNNSFDKIICQHIVEHLNNFDIVLEELKRILKNNGCLIIVTPNINYPDNNLFYDPDHKHIFSLFELKKILENHGFIIDKSYTLMPRIIINVFKKKYNLGVKFWRLFKFIKTFFDSGQTIFINSKVK